MAVVGITLDKPEVVEGEVITLTINVDGDIPPEGLTVLINDVVSAANPVVRALSEFDIANVQLTGISGFPIPAEGDSGFFATIIEPTAIITLPVFDDGFDENEPDEVFTFAVIDDEAYDVDPDASSVTLSIADNEVANEPRISDFEDGTVQAWTVGQPGNHFAPPTNIPNGGPDGAEDNYLGLQSEGGQGVGSRLVWFNQSADWRGNYLEDGMNTIEASLINEGREDVVIRVGFDGPGGRFVTTQGITLTPGSGWQEATFNIEPEDLTPDGGTDVEATLRDVAQIRFLNNPNPQYRGVAVAAQVGVDDITFTNTEIPRLKVSLFTGPNYLIEDEGTVSAHAFLATEGVIPEGGLVVSVDAPNLSEFDLTGVSVDGGEIVAVGEGSFDLRMTEYTTLVNLPIANDGETETGETASFSLAAGDGYEIVEDYSGGSFGLVDTRTDIPQGVINEPNDVIGFATDTQISPENPTFFGTDGVYFDIGNRYLNEDGTYTYIDYSEDVDVYKVDLSAGDTITIETFDFDTNLDEFGVGFAINAFVYDAEGNQLQDYINTGFDPAAAPDKLFGGLGPFDVNETDSYDEFTAPADGSYFIALGDDGQVQNFWDVVAPFYEPNTPGFGNGNRSIFGDYSIETQIPHFKM